MNTKDFWTKLFDGDRQCKEEMVPDRRRDDSMHVFRTRDQRNEQSDDENEDEPDTVYLFNQWKSLMLHCATVSIDSAERCVICVPFLNVHDEKVKAIFGKSNRDLTEIPAVTWLARALAEVADFNFAECGMCFCYFFTRKNPSPYLVSRNQILA